MNVTAKNNSGREHRLFIGVKNYFKGLGVALLGCRLNSSFYGRCRDLAILVVTTTITDRPITAPLRVHVG